jgi:hypothetical protein
MPPESATLDPPPPQTAAPPSTEDASLGDLLKQLRDETLTLFKQEAALIRTEVGEKVKQAAIDTAKVPAGGIVALIGVTLILVALSNLVAWALMALLDLTMLPALMLGFVAIGGITTLVGVVLLKRGLSRLANEDITPTQTITSVKENAAWAKEKTS